MNTQTRRLIAAIAGVVALVGLLLGYFPVSKGGVSCGSAFGGGGDALSTDLASTLGGSAGVTHYADACADNLQVWRVIAIAVLIIGLGVAAIMFTPRDEQLPVRQTAP